MDRKATDIPVLDRKDRVLIDALRKNARASLVTLARAIDLSRSATHDRISRLEERGILRGYTIRVDEALIDDVRAFMTVALEQHTDRKALTTRISEMTGVEVAYCLSGDIDLLVDCRCETSNDLGQLREQIGALDGIVSCNTRLVLAVHD